MIYQDHYDNTFFQYASMLWLFNHWDTVDRSRFDQQKLAALESEIAAMKQKGLKPDPNFVDEQAEKATEAARQSDPEKGFLEYAELVCLWTAVVVLACFLGWFVFFRQVR